MKFILFLLACISFLGHAFSQGAGESNLNKGYDTTFTNQWSGASWMPYRRSMYTNNAQCLTTSILTQSWVPASSAWVNFTLETITYTSNSQVSVYLNSSWDASSNSFIPGSRNTYTYNSNNLLQGILGEVWNQGWQTNYLFTYTYNADQTIHQVLESINSGGQTFVVRLTYSYPDNTSYQVLTERDNSGVWVNSSRNTIHFLGSAERVSTTLSESWTGSQWVNSIYQSRTYDNVSTYLTNALTQQWSNIFQSFVNSTQINYTNNPNGTVKKEESQQWNTGTNTWTNQTQTLYTYKCNNVLPLTLLVFTVSKNNGSPVLTWQTINEINSDHFIVQRNFNGSDFIAIARINTRRGNSSVENYNYSDNISTRYGKVYYRLQIVDKDGREAYSGIESIALDKSSTGFAVGPNPAHGFILVTTGSPNSVVSVADLFGRTVLRQNIKSAGEHRLDISALPKGSYICTKTDGVLTSQKIIID